MFKSASSSFCTRLSLIKTRKCFLIRPAVCTRPVVESRNLLEYSNLLIKVLSKLLAQRNLWITP